MSCYIFISALVTTYFGGGIARFCKYVDIVFCNFTPKTKYSLASANLGARIVHETLNKLNIYGWLTPRSRKTDRNNSIDLSLAATVPLKSLIISTTDFKGNSPLKIRTGGCDSNKDDPYLDGCTRWFSLEPELSTINYFVRFIIHKAVLISYYSWRHSHIKHHVGLGDMAKEPSNVPLTRSNVGLPPREKDPQADEPHSMFEEMPIYDGWTSYFNPYCNIFTEKQFWPVVSLILVMPHYNCEEAAVHLKEALGKYYLGD
ncbi:hypothetical protein BD770DRAFT_469296 [Pilaira anomala]|nr:hypothetical protein BD770DRAFT_469296 [Pilaira anomala]